MANVRDSDTSLWLHNKLGTSNDSWISGSICSQLNKEVLRNIKECFPDLQTQVKLKLLLSFFHIPRRLVEEWKTELEEVIEVAGLDSELWVSMIAETMKTFPATSSLNTEISEYEDTRPIFTDMVNDLRKLVNKHADLGMLPLECQYLNKNALISVVGQQPAPVKHFTLKRKPKSAQLRSELLHKSADAQSSLKKSSAPTIPLRSRGMPRKMTDTTPLKGIPSRVPTTGFRSPNVPPNQQRPNLSRTPAGRKDGGIKLIEFTEQPLGYAAAKKRKREQQLEEQQKKQEQKQQAAAAAAAAAASTATTNAVGGAGDDEAGTSTAHINNNGTSDGDSPTTPKSTNNSFEIKTEPQHNQSSASIDDPQEDVKPSELAVKTPISETPTTPEYAATLSYSQVSSTPSQSEKITEQKSSPTKTSIVTTPKSSISAQSKINNNNNSNNNSYHHTPKRIKQEIEIKSEEILVPASIKVEKIDPPSQTTLIQTLPSQQQRVIIQQQQPGQPTQHLLIRSTSQQGKLPTQNTVTTTIGGTTIKMEKLDIKPIVRHQAASTVTSTPTVTASTSAAAAAAAAAAASSSTTPTTTIISQQQLRQAINNPLVHLPNNISVKITSTKSKNPNAPSTSSAAAAAAAAATASSSQSSQLIHQQTQPSQPILINSSTPVILASTPTQSMRTLSTTTTTIPTQSIKTMPLSQIKTAANSGPVIISQTIIQPAKRTQQQQQQQQHPTPSGASTSAAAAAAAAAASAAVAPAASSSSQQVQVQGQQQQPQTHLITAQAQQQPQSQLHTHPQVHQPQQTTQYIITTPQHSQQIATSLPTLTSFTPTRSVAQPATLYQTASPSIGVAATTPHTPTKIVLKTSSSSGVVMTPVRQPQQTTIVSTNPPPLVATTAAIGAQQVQPGQPGQPVGSSVLNIQNVQLPNRPVTIQPASQAAQQQHMQQQMQQQHPQHTIVSNTTATQQPKLSQVIVQPASTVGNTGISTVNVSPTTGKNKTIILTQKGVILRNIGGDVYQQIPISNVSGLQGISGGATIMTTTAAGPPGLVKTTPSTTALQPQTIQIQQQPQQQATKQHALPQLIPTNSLSGQHIIVQQQPTANVIGNGTQQTIIRPVMTTLPQGLTLIQRPGQQPQLVQVQSAPATTQRIITQTAPSQQQLRAAPQQIVVQHKPAGIPTTQRIITTTTGNAATQAQTQTRSTVQTHTAQQIQQIQQHQQQQQQQQQSQQQQQQTRTVQVQPQQQTRTVQVQQQQQQAPQRKGLSLSNEHVHKAHEMFRKANRVSRPDKALILGFMAGLRENPRPNSENVLIIKLGETEEKVQQEDGTTALCLAESLIRLDYNTGEWKTFQNYRLVDQGSAS